MTAEQVEDPTAVQLCRYDDGRVVIVAGGKEYGPPRYEHDIYLVTENSTFNNGNPVSRGIVVRDMRSREVVVRFGARIEAERRG